ncbi:hypothetical protein [Endobacterium cereale]|uniref:hypothetical protein n=1 Tax=Endobacterium cereale TaxID=2663029 RepID=UPI002B494B26|nr:hypothetical protein [Endobacterium cereale]MEB2846814.1 hypothetical protein [Endobacterium cereale]
MNSLNGLGIRDHKIAESLGYSRQYLSLMRSKRVAPDHILAALQKLLISKLADAETAIRAEADLLATERQKIEAEARGA